MALLLASIMLSACDKGSDGASSSGADSSSAVDDTGHVVVYEEEIYKNWPYQ